MAAIIASELQVRLSGGANNSDVNASLGGAKSSVSLISLNVNNLFDDVSSVEALSGDTEYRCVYFHNANTTNSAITWKAWIYSNTTSPDTRIEIGLGSAAINGTEQTVINESTTPTNVTFVSTPISEQSALSLGTVPPGQSKSVWIKRIVTAGSAAFTNDTAVLRHKCETRG